MNLIPQEHDGAEEKNYKLPEAIVKKIKGLYNMSVDDGATSEERKTASFLLNKLLNKFGYSYEEIHKLIEIADEQELQSFEIFNFGNSDYDVQTKHFYWHQGAELLVRILLSVGGELWNSKGYRTATIKVFNKELLEFVLEEWKFHWTLIDNRLKKLYRNARENNKGFFYGYVETNIPKPLPEKVKKIEDEATKKARKENTVKLSLEAWNGFTSGKETDSQRQPKIDLLRIESDFDKQNGNY